MTAFATPEFVGEDDPIGPIAPYVSLPDVDWDEPDYLPRYGRGVGDGERY